MPFVCVVGGRRDERRATVARLVGSRRPLEARPAPQWPFTRDLMPAWVPDEPCTVLVPNLHLAFPAGQTPGTRLVLTQSTYQLQRWLDWLTNRPQVTVVAHASRVGLERGAAEAFAGRGPWQAIERVELDSDEEPGAAETVEEAVPGLREAFAASTVTERRERVIRAAQADPENPALQLAAGSVHMELDQWPDAQRAVERALVLAPDWEAVPFEYGKLWLRGDDLERAATRFAQAAQLMPSFSAALSNLGATLAETDRPEEAMQALQQARTYDPTSHTILNNLSVLCRENGRLDEAIDAARGVTALVPDFPFGHYNLGHALFLQGRFPEALEAYEEGHRRDTQKNPVQGCRLAMARAGAGDYDGAIGALGVFVDQLSAEARRDMLDEVEEVLGALAGLPGALAGEVERVLTVVRRRRRD